MTALIFAPALLCVAALFYWDPARVLRNVCLPILLLLPTYFYWKTDGFPGLDFCSAALIPLGVVLVPLLGSRWRFTRSDLWMLLYILSCAVSDLRLNGASTAKYRLFEAVVAALIPYMAGKLLIEQVGARFEVVSRMALVLSLACLVAIPEFFIKLNLFSRIGMHFFPTEWPGWWTQVRWGFGRVAGPYGTAEIYGLILLMALLLLLWVHAWSTPAMPFARTPLLSSRRLIQACMLLLAVTLLMTQSRGPWLGTLLAVPVALVGRAKRVKRAGLLLLVVLAAVAVPAYVAGEHYVSGPRRDFGSQQETAQYRRELLINYLPIAEKGGLWGWGTFHPILNGQPSIDNEFLRVFLVQGYIGLLAYLLLILESGYCLIQIGLRSPPGSDRHFCFTLLGIFTGWVLTLCTVYMGAQSYQLFFLLVGWTQAISLIKQQVRPQTATVAERVQPSLTRVYT